MKITDIRLEPANDPSGRLLAYCVIVFDDQLLVRGIRLILTARGKYILAMPDRKDTDHCPECNKKNPIDACFCNQCGIRLADNRVKMNEDGYPQLYLPLAYPIHDRFRYELVCAVARAYFQEVALARADPAYVWSYYRFKEEMNHMKRFKERYEAAC